MEQKIETLIIGGGQGGLATSYYLARLGHENLVLEQASLPGNAWRNGRWDSFTLVTPNRTFQLPGADYGSTNPDGFMGRDEIVAAFEHYAASQRLPVQYDTLAASVEPLDDGGYRVLTNRGTWQVCNEVVATGLFQKPKIPPFSVGLPGHITQLAAGQYRNPSALPAGAVLVVGTGQSGCQIAEELYQRGRRVYLCVGSAGRVPRRYRGRDITAWLQDLGWFERTVAMLPSPKARFTANPHLSGRDGGHTLNLHQFFRDGVTLLGHLQDARDGKIVLAADLHESLARVDRFEADLLKKIDDFIVQKGIGAPLESPSVLRDGFSAPQLSELDLAAAGITSVIWALGYNFDFSLVKLPVFDEDGFPFADHGVTHFPGLYFVGMPWLNTQKTGQLGGVGETAAHIATAIANHH